MNALENKIPPPLVALLTAVMMWVIGRDTPALTVDNTLRLALAGVLVLLARAGFRAFGRANTTTNRVDIEAASTLVTSGIYSNTRNPMYLGLVAFLLAWAVYLAVPQTLLGPLAFVLLITRFQIIPEERVLLKKFGDPYDRLSAACSPLDLSHLPDPREAVANLLASGSAITHADPISKAMQISKTLCVPAMK